MTNHRLLTSNVRNSVLKICRLTDLASLYHIRSEFNLANLGTIPGTLQDVDPKNTLFSGHQWMKEQPEDWPVTQASDLSISEHDRDEAGREMKSSFASAILTISGRKSGSKVCSWILFSPVGSGRSTSWTESLHFARKSRGERYKGPSSALEYFAQKSTQLLKSQRQSVSTSSLTCFGSLLL